MYSDLTILFLSKNFIFVFSTFFLIIGYFNSVVITKYISVGINGDKQVDTFTKFVIAIK